MSSMRHIYEVVKAKDHAEAVQLSPYFEGQKAQVIGIHTSANSDGTYSVFPQFKLTEVKGGEPNPLIKQ